MNRQLGLIVLGNDGGIGNQSHRLCQFLKPERILYVDSSGFSKNAAQHKEWYEGFSGYTVNGFPNNREVDIFLKDLTHVFLIENPFNFRLISESKRLGIKTYIQSNFEFCDHLIQPHLPLPDMFLMPSYWMIEDMVKRYGENRVQYLPPPVFPEEFSSVRDENFNRKGKKRFLHIVGTLAAKDRNGTLLLLQALKYTHADFDLVIKSQHVLPPEYNLFDARVSFKIGSEAEVSEMYRGYDAMIMPRRFGGLCLPMCEAMMCGLPVIMSDISPNNHVLPKSWLVPAQVEGSIMTRSMINLYATDPYQLANKIDEFANMDLETLKVEAFDIAHKEYAPSSLISEYDKIWLL